MATENALPPTGNVTAMMIVAITAMKKIVVCTQGVSYKYNFTLTKLFLFVVI